MSRIAYFESLQNHREPARDWIEKQDSHTREDIYLRIRILSVQGLGLLGTKTMAVIRGPDKGFYELRNRTLNWRLGLFHDRILDSFVLLHGWRHDKQYQREIEAARSFLREYRAQQGRPYG